MKPLFREGYFCKHPAVRLFARFTLSRYGFCARLGDRAFGFTWK